jgi:two-component system OmpR family response regulator
MYRAGQARPGGREENLPMPEGTRCVVVDDDPDVRRDLAAYLSGFGLRATALADGAALRRYLASQGADVVVLDLMLPGEDGLALLRWLQAEHPALPVLMLTARGDAASRVVGLELGADDYIAKPFEPRELVARLQAVLRRAAKGRQAGEPGRVVRFEGWRLDRVLRELRRVDDVVLPLSSAEFRLLAVFVERPGRVLSREKLLELTRAAGVDVSDRSIDLAVSRLRAKLGDGHGDETPRLIRTVRGVGYLFDARVEEPS